MIREFEGIRIKNELYCSIILKYDEEDSPTRPPNDRWYS